MNLMRTAIGFFICLFTACAFAQEQQGGLPGVEVDIFTAFMAHEALDVEDLAEGAEIQRRFYNRITPPGVELFQSMTPSVVPFDSAYFSTAFLNRLLGRTQNSVAVYPLVLVWDDEAEQTYIFNAEGGLIATAPGESRDWLAGANPERVILQLDLLPMEDVEPFLYTEQRVEESLRTLSPPEEEGSARSPGSGRFQIQHIQRLTNGAIQISVTNSTTNVAEIYAYTMWYEGSNTVTTWTNDENVVVTTTSTTWRSISENVNGMQSVWDCLTNSLALTNGAGAFADEPLPFEARVRLYAAAEYRDSDRDGLSDGQEIFTYKTDAYEPDADGDGWNDGEEINAVPPTDPFDRLSSPNPPARRVLINAVHYSTNDTEDHYVQLHSAARYPIDLSGFRLQVSNTNVFETRFIFPEETIIRPGRFLLIGGSNVTGRDFTAVLSLPQSYTNLPTAAIRLMPPMGGIFPADVLFYGSHRPFNDLNLPVEGWQTLTDGTLYAGTGSQLVRRELGVDRDLRGDWTYAVIGTNPLWNSETILDSDRDGLTDGDEYSGSDNTREPTDPQNPDSDGDGLEDAFELEHGLDPNNSDTGSTGTPDGGKINPETGRTYAEDQLGYGMTVEMETAKPDWVMGSSIGSNGWVRFDLSEVDGIGIWATIREGGLEPENFMFSVDGATILYTENSYVSGFRTVQCLLMPAGTNTGVTIYDGGTYWPDQSDNSLGPDIFARFQAVKIKLEVNGVNVTNESYVYIAPEPAMPAISVYLSPTNILPGNVGWRGAIRYNRKQRGDEQTYPVSSWRTLSAKERWNFTEEMATDIRGGTFNISCLYGGIITTQTLYIRGENPVAMDVEAVLAVPGQPWYAIPIAKHESGYSGGIYRQFNTVGTLGPGVEDYRYCPNWGIGNAGTNAGGGWGIMQLDTPAPVAQELWNWEANLADGLSRLRTKRVDAVEWIERQEAQQATEEPDMLLENEVFVFNGIAFQKGTGRTPEDACTIQAYNIATTWVIYWQNKTATNAGSWQINPERRSYVDSVCGRID